MTLLRSTSIALLALLLALADPAHASARTPQILLAEAEQGNAEAQFLLARAHLKGEGVPKNPTKAYLWMKKAADQGYPDAIGGMGYFYSAGVEVERDEVEAVRRFREGVEKGSVRALLNLGLVTANGRGVELNQAEGLRMIDDAAAKSLPEAINAQAETYFYGQFGRTMDYEKARASYCLAAEAGIVGAQNILGVIYRDALGVDRDHEIALQWFRRAAEQGDVRGQSNFGHLLGVESPDTTRRIEAIKWVTLAADQKEVTAVKTLEELTASIPEDVAAARAAANLFHEKSETAER